MNEIVLFLICQNYIVIYITNAQSVNIVGCKYFFMEVMKCSMELTTNDEVKGFTC
jgi:hypothetical protein